MTTVPLPDTRQAAITIVTQVIRGDLDAVQRVLDAYDVDEFVPAMHASLALLRALALKLRSAEGLMAVDVWLAETSHDERRSRDSRIAAQRVLGHAGTCYPPVETITAAETFADLYSIGASTFNAACCQADYRIVEVFVAAMALWRPARTGGQHRAGWVRGVQRRRPAMGRYSQRRADPTRLRPDPNRCTKTRRDKNFQSQNAGRQQRRDARPSRAMGARPATNAATLAGRHQGVDDHIDRVGGAAPPCGGGIGTGLHPATWAAAPRRGHTWPA